MNKQNIEHAFEAGERLHERLAKGFRYTADGQAIATPDGEWLLYLEQLERTAKRLASTQRAVIIKGKNWRGDTCYTLTSLGENIRALCVNALPLVERTAVGFNLIGRSFLKTDDTRVGIAADEPYTVVQAIPNPWVTVMLRAALRIAKVLENDFPAEWGDVNEPHIRKAYEHAAMFVRRVCRSKPFKTVISNHQRSAQKNLDSCLNYVTNLFRAHSKLLVLRVDLYVHSDHHAWSASDSAAECIDDYLRALRESRLIEPDIKGWIAKREGGCYRGIHYHLMVFLDGHKHQKGYIYSQQLGEAWQNRYSDGKGTFFNCWALRKKYKYNALGVVHVADWIMLTGLRIALSYMTKEDCALETGRSRNLRRGIHRRLTGTPKQGAPRKAANDLAVLKRVFSEASSAKLF